MRVSVNLKTTSAPVVEKSVSSSSVRNAPRRYTNFLWSIIEKNKVPKIKIMTINSFWPATYMVVKMHLCLDYVAFALQVLMLMQ